LKAATPSHLAVGIRPVLAGAVLLSTCVLAYAEPGPALPRLKVDGRRLLDPSGKEVVLKGCNLGNWLLIEPWMMAAEEPTVRDQHAFITLLQSRFGAEKAERLMEELRANWITARELKLARSFGFNVVRVPFDHHLLAGDDKPFELRDDAFQWLDKAVDLSEQAGIYVILDMHGAPGGQSVEAPCGYIDSNQLWGSETNLERAAWLWQRIAERYRDRNAVVAYDLVNEPWGDGKTDVRPALVALIDRLHKAIREVDAAKLLFAPGSREGVKFYGTPKEHGWTNLGFTEHFYPGLFGNGSPSLETHARFLDITVPAKAKMIDAMGVPYLLGEFNVVFDQAARASTMRRYYDAFASHGWVSTMWSIRGISPRGKADPNRWFLETNAEPFTLPDLHKAAYEEIESAFRRLGSQPVLEDDDLRKAMTAAVVDGPRMPAFSPPITGKPPADAIAGWTGADVSTAVPGGQKRSADGVITLCGAGSDIWGVHDEFRYLYRKADEDFDLRVQLTSLDASHRFAKAGWMLRESLDPDAAHVLVNAYPDGCVMLAWRGKRGQPTQERALSVGGLPVGLGLQRQDGRVLAWYTDADGRWQSLAVPDSRDLSGLSLIGLVASSHDEAVLAMASFRGLDQPPASISVVATPIAGAAAPNLLTNASFELVKDAAKATDQARGWDRWGNWFNREEQWKPQRDGSCLLGYHHWQIEKADSSGVYQDVNGLTPGGRYTFGVYANRDIPASGKQGPRDVEIRLESPVGGRLLAVASQTYSAASLASGDAWSYLHVTGTLPGETARVLIIVNPSGEGPRDAALKFDQASLVVEPGKSVGSIKVTENREVKP